MDTGDTLVNKIEASALMELTFRWGKRGKKKTKTKTKQQQNATEMNIRGNWVKCIRALSVPFLLFFCKSKIKTQKTNKQNIYLIMSAMKKCQSGKEIGN